jgi:hypothetical protein
MIPDDVIGHQSAGLRKIIIVFKQFVQFLTSLCNKIKGMVPICVYKNILLVYTQEGRSRGFWNLVVVG